MLRETLNALGRPITYASCAICQREMTRMTTVERLLARPKPESTTPPPPPRTRGVLLKRYRGRVFVHACPRCGGALREDYDGSQSCINCGYEEGGDT